MLINILILFFIYVILYQMIYQWHNNFYSSFSLIEGLENSGGNEYKDYDIDNPNNTLILAQQNAGNIRFLKGRMDDLDVAGLKKKVDDLSTNVSQLNSQVEGLIAQQAHAVTNITGGKTPQISGTTEPMYSAKKV